MFSSCRQEPPQDGKSSSRSLAFFSLSSFLFPFASSPPWSQPRAGTGDLNVVSAGGHLTPIQGGVEGVGGTPGGSVEPWGRGLWTVGTERHPDSKQRGRHGSMALTLAYAVLALRPDETPFVGPLLQ